MIILGLVTVSDWLLVLIAFLTVIYWYVTKSHGVLKRLGIPGPTPWPVYGNLNHMIKHGFADIDELMIKKYGKVYGFYEGTTPTVVVADTDMLRDILVKEFPNFTNRRVIQLRGLLKKSVMDAEGDYWKHIRSLLTPCFSTGKLKQMTPLIDDCVKTFVSNFDSIHEAGEAFEAKQLTGAFTMDVIAATGFGLQVNSQKDSKHPLIVNVRELFKKQIILDWKIGFMLCFRFLIPVLKWCGKTSLMPQDIEKFFVDFITLAIEERKKNPQARKDLLTQMLQAEKDLAEADEEVKQDIRGLEDTSGKRKYKGLTNEEVISQCFLFFIAGYETTGTTMANLLYHLALNQDVQDRVVEEIDAALTEEQGNIYETVSKLTYMDQCINETIRICPPTPRMDRRVERDTVIKGLRLPKDMLVMIPFKALQMDPAVWPNPEKFDPNRHTPEERSKRSQFQLMPFGMGPRACIGQRLAMMEMKMALCGLLQKYKVVPCEKTQIPLTFKKTFLPQSEHGIWLKVETRK